MRWATRRLEVCVFRSPGLRSHETSVVSSRFLGCVLSLFVVDVVVLYRGTFSRSGVQRHPNLFVAMSRWLLHLPALRDRYALPIRVPLVYSCRSTFFGLQYTQTTARPGYDHIDRSSTLNSTDVRGTSYELMSPTPNAFHPPTREPAKKHNPQSSLGSGKSKTLASQLSAAASSVAKLEQSSHSQASTRGLEEARATEGSGDPESSHVPDTTTLPTRASPCQPGPYPPPPVFSRRPTTTPVLLPEYRYCSRCQIVKPSRAHHCRACGTVSFLFRRPRARHPDLVSSAS